jgi:carboxyl-terminal processing protease
VLLVPLATLGPQRAALAQPEVAAADAQGQSEGQGSQPAHPVKTAPTAATPAQEQADLLAKVREYYVKPADERELRRGAIRGMIDALHDPQSAYLDPDEFAALERQMGGTLTGIGVQVEVNEGRVGVLAPLPDSPAFRAGLRPRDVILEVDGQPTRGLEFHAVARRIAGPAGTPVTLRIRRGDGQELDLTVTRARITIPAVCGFRRAGDRGWDFWLDRDHGIGYVHVGRFEETTVRELKDVVLALKGMGMRGLVLDLRFCPGGFLDAAIGVARLFLKQGTIVSMRGRQGGLRAWEADGQGWLGDFPLVLLVNEKTASSAEVLTGALKDNGRAVVIGTRTQGKGSVQAIIKLEGSGVVKLTTAYYLPPSGRNIDHAAGATTWGIDPTEGDYVSLDDRQTDALLRRRAERDFLDVAPAARARADRPLTPEQIAHAEADPQLAAALRALLARLETGAFRQVGQPNAGPLAQLRRRQEMKKQREQLLKQLEEVDKELKALDSQSVSEPPKERS